MHGRSESIGASPTGDDDSHPARMMRIVYLAEDVLCVSLPSEGHSMARAPELTPAERDVVALALAGHTNTSIAQRRGSAPRTVANQLASVYRKLGISGRRELAAAVG